MNTELNLSFLFTISRKVDRHLQICHAPLFYAPFAEPLVASRYSRILPSDDNVATGNASSIAPTRRATRRARPRQRGSTGLRCRSEAAAIPWRIVPQPRGTPRGWSTSASLVADVASGCRRRRLLDHCLGHRRRRPHRLRPIRLPNGGDSGRIPSRTRLDFPSSTRRMRD